MPDGTPFDVPGDSPLPTPLDVPENAAGQTVWLTMPAAASNTREVDHRSQGSASRYTEGAETVIDSTSELRSEQEIDLAYPRLAYEMRRTPKPGFLNLGIGRILEIRDKLIIFDERYAPPLLVFSAHPVVTGWLNRVIG